MASSGSAMSSACRASRWGDLERRVRAEGLVDFTVERRGDNPDLYVVTLIEPLARNAAALGRDVGGGTTRRSAAVQAMRTGEAIITKPIALIEGTENVQGALLFLPVYAPGFPQTDAAERERALRGWVYASLRVDELLANIGAATDGQIEYEVFDAVVGAPPAAIFAAGGRVAFGDADWHAGAPAGAAFTASATGRSMAAPGCSGCGRRRFSTRAAIAGWRGSFSAAACW